MYFPPMPSPPGLSRDDANPGPAILMSWFAALLQPLVIMVILVIMVVHPSDTEGHVRAGVRLLSITLGVGVAGAISTVIATGVLLLVWQARAQRMADRLHLVSHRSTPGTAPASRALPVVSCLLPYRPIIDLVRTVDPRNAAGRTGRSRSERRVWLWWVAWLTAGTVLLLVVAQLLWLFCFGDWPLPGNDAGFVLGYLAYTLLALVPAPLLTGVLRPVCEQLRKRSAAVSDRVGDQ